VQPGEFVAITGRSGAGKSTLLNLIGGLATPSAGRVVIGGTDIARLNERERAAFRRTHVGVIYQTDNLIPFLTAQLSGGERQRVEMTVEDRTAIGRGLNAIEADGHFGHLVGGEKVCLT